MTRQARVIGREKNRQSKRRGTDYQRRPRGPQQLDAYNFTRQAFGGVFVLVPLVRPHSSYFNRIMGLILFTGLRLLGRGSVDKLVVKSDFEPCTHPNSENDH